MILNCLTIVILMATVEILCSVAPPDKEERSLIEKQGDVKGDKKAYHQYFLKLAESLASHYLHSYDLAMFYIQIDIGKIDILSLSNEIFLYDIHTNIYDYGSLQIAWALHLLRNTNTHDARYQSILKTRAESMLSQKDMRETMNNCKIVYREYNLNLCAKIEGAKANQYTFNKSVLIETIKKMIALEILNLRKTFDISSHNSEADGRYDRNFIKGVADILVKITTDLKALELTFITEFKNYKLYAIVGMQNFFSINCKGWDANFDAPRLSLETYYATHVIYRPIRLTDYATKELHILKDFANEYRIDVERQIAKLLHEDKKNLIVLFMPGVTTFFSVEFEKIEEEKSLGIFVDNANEFASQRFRFYRHAIAIAGEQLLIEEAKLRNKTSFNVAFNVLENMAGKNFPFKIFSSNQVLPMIDTIKANKNKFLTHGYQSLCEQIITIIGLIDTTDQCANIVPVSTVDYAQLLELHLENFRNILNSQVKKCMYLKRKESDLIRNLLIEQKIQLHNQFTTSQKPGAKFFCDQLNAAKTEMMNTLFTNGVYVSPRINNNYPWDRIIQEFSDTNPDSVIIDYLEQAKERSEIAIESLKSFISSVDVESNSLRQIIITEQYAVKYTLENVDEQIREIFRTLKVKMRASEEREN